MKLEIAILVFVYLGLIRTDGLESIRSVFRILGRICEVNPFSKFKISKTFKFKIFLYAALSAAFYLNVSSLGKHFLLKN